jgi:hypothetical protein
VDVGEGGVERRVGLLEVEQAAVDVQLHAGDRRQHSGDPELAAHLDVEQEVGVDVTTVLELELRLATH